MCCMLSNIQQRPSPNFLYILKMRFALFVVIALWFTTNDCISSCNAFRIVYNYKETAATSPGCCASAGRYQYYNNNHHHNNQCADEFVINSSNNNASCRRRLQPLMRMNGGNDKGQSDPEKIKAKTV